MTNQFARFRYLMRAIFVTVGVTFLSAGCAEERAPINRVQPDALAKSFFVGADLVNDVDNPDFYANGTLLDVSYGANQSGLFSAFYSNDLSIIRWEIQEDLLLGRLAFERIEGSDGLGAGPRTNDGQVIYGFVIEKHFDIRHAYNPSTGEEQNVIEENSSDRPWYQREYFRIDWSRNLVTSAYDFDTLAVQGIFSGTTWESIDYYVNDPNHEHAPRFETEDGYFDITTRAYATPGNIDLSHLGWGIDSIPACFLTGVFAGGTYPSGNCNPVEVSIRHSFYKRPNDDYEPQDWDGYRFQAAGAFTKERMGYERNYGMSDQKWRRFISRYNIWERSHYYDDPESMTGAVECYTPDTLAYGEDPNADANADGTEDRCSAVSQKLAGNVCGGYEFGSGESTSALSQVISDATLSGAGGPCAIPAGQEDPCSGLATNAEECTALLDNCCAVLVNGRGGGSKCDTFNQKCTQPYRHREVKPIVWYYTNNSDYEFFDASVAAGRQWDVAMKLAVQSARHAECESLGRQDCWYEYPTVHGQMTMMKDLTDIEDLVDACRRSNGNWNVQACEGVILQELAERGYDPQSEDYLGIHAMAMMDDTVVLCHSPVAADDHPACAPGKPRLPSNISPTDCQEAKTTTGNQAVIDACNAAYTVRTGDVRHHLINVIPNPQTPSPWGFGPTYSDPLTGQGISASINVWANPTNRIAQATLDQARFVAGEITPEQVTNGEYIEAYVNALENSHADGRGMIPRMTKDDVQRQLRETVKSYGRDFKTGASPDVHEHQGRHSDIANEVDPELLATHHELEGLPSVRAHARESSAFGDAYRNRLSNAQGTQTEAELMMDRHMKELVGGTTHASLPSTVVTEMASPFRAFSNPTVQRELHQLREVGLAQRHACSLNADDFAPSPSAIIGMSTVLQQKFGDFNATDPMDVQLARAAKMQRYLAYKMHYSVIIHEMGHTFGFRHNFVSSSSAFFYRPQYWQLRTKNGSVETECTQLATDDAAAGNCVGPRYFDPITEEEQSNMIGMWAHSSTMDYAGDYTQDLLGLGAYDFHAARMMYGETATVFEHGKYNKDETLSVALHETIMDSFGGILGLKYQNGPSVFPTGATNIHYSQLNAYYGLINNCVAVDPELYRPTDWDTELLGEWNPLVDGEIVQVNGQYTRCYQPRVDYVPWSSLRNEADSIDNPSDQPTGSVGPSIDRFNRTRVPYGFATDGWADVGNLAVYRHDVGADPYELFSFFITEQELRHIFDDFRRDRSDFSVRSAAYRALGRYNEKMRDGAKGIALIKNNLDDFAHSAGFIPSTIFQLYTTFWNMDENLLASGMAFDHFARQLQRPNSGGHSDSRSGNDPMTVPLISAESADFPPVTIPEGPMGFWQNVSYGGKRTYNDLSSEHGEYDRDYTLNAGAYYDKAFVPMLLSESADNFISSSLDPFIDARFRATSMADLFADGYRRLLANNLTGEAWLKGARVAALAPGPIPGDGGPTQDVNGFPTEGIGWISWWTETPELCFANTNTRVCTGYDEQGNPFQPTTPSFTRPLDAQVGWEQQKFLIAYTLAYIPANQKEDWLNMLGIWALGSDSDPEFANRIELHTVTGDIYVARTYGTEEICFEQCKTVQRGIGARILEYANELNAAAYVTTEVTQNGTTWYVPVLDANGNPIVRFDGDLTWLTPQGEFTSAPDDCTEDPDPNDTDYSSFAGCECEHNAACTALEDYLSVPEFMRQSMMDLQIAPASMKGLY